MGPSAGSEIKELHVTAHRRGSPSSLFFYFSVCSLLLSLHTKLSRVLLQLFSKQRQLSPSHLSSHNSCINVQPSVTSIYHLSYLNITNDALAVIRKSNLLPFSILCWVTVELA